MPKVVLFDFSEQPSLGLASLQHSLQEKGISCLIVNLYAKEEFDFKARVESALKAIMKNREAIKEAKYLGMPFFRQDFEIRARMPIAKGLKARFPEKILIGGGVGLISNPRGFFRKGMLDYALIGEAEKTLPQLIIALEERRSAQEIEKIPGIIMKKGSRIFVSKTSGRLSQTELEKMPLLSSLLGKRAIVFTERGCPFKCIFCSCPNVGSVRYMSEDRIIQGLKELAQNKKITLVQFQNDQFLANRQRALSLVRRLSSEGLNKRFKFGMMTSVDLFYRKGVIDAELIQALKKARFGEIALGVEAFNDNILKEIKHGRYTAIQASRLIKELSRNGFHTDLLTIAASIKTKPSEFAQSIYTMAALSARRRASVVSPGMIHATPDMPVFKTAAREGVLYGLNGKKANESTARKNLKNYYALPKDERLRELFIRILKKKRIDGFITSGKDLADLRKFVEENAPEYSEKFKRLEGLMRANALDRKVKDVVLKASVRGLMREKTGAEKSGSKDVEKFYGSLPLGKRKALIRGAVDFVEDYRKVQGRIARIDGRSEKLSQGQGLKRLRMIQKARSKFGISPISGFNAIWRRRLPK
ncbi:MAG: radical SAM protein [Candidatus Diapherotrites archaeon]|nr:radical SAM protein [Candidatus Diapherotrites archaeon]